VSWVQGRFYIRSVRQDGLWSSQYVGAGPLGEAAAALDAEVRANRRAQAQAWHARKAHLLALDALLKRFDEVANLLTHAHLLAAGYHQHDRGQWRKYRAQKKRAKKRGSSTVRQAPKT
jgi:hypothetical protein